MAIYDAMMLAVIDASRNLNLGYSLPSPETSLAAPRGGVGDGDEGGITGASALDLCGAILAHSPRDMLSFFNLKCEHASPSLLERGRIVQNPQGLGF